MKKFLIHDIVSMTIAYTGKGRKIYRCLECHGLTMREYLMLVIENKDGYIDHYTMVDVKYEHGILRMFKDYTWDPKDIENVQWDFINGRR